MNNENEDKRYELMFPLDGKEDYSPLQDALMSRTLGDSEPLQELVDSGELTPAELERLASIRRLWPADAQGALYRKRGRSPGVVLKPLAPVERDFVEWVRAERKARCGWLQTNRLPDGEIEELIERAFVKFPDAERLSERRKEFIRRLIDRPTDHRLL